MAGQTICRILLNILPGPMQNSSHAGRVSGQRAAFSRRNEFRHRTDALRAGLVFRARRPLLMRPEDELAVCDRFIQNRRLRPLAEIDVCLRLGAGRFPFGKQERVFSERKIPPPVEGDCRMPQEPEVIHIQHFHWVSRN